MWCVPISKAGQVSTVNTPNEGQVHQQQPALSLTRPRASQGRMVRGQQCLFLPQALVFAVWPASGPSGMAGARHSLHPIGTGTAGADHAGSARGVGPGGVRVERALTALVGPAIQATVSPGSGRDGRAATQGPPGTRLL